MFKDKIINWWFRNINGLGSIWPCLLVWSSIFMGVFLCIYISVIIISFFERFLR